MFFGEFDNKLDEKSRVPIPPKFRRDLNDKGVPTRGVEHCSTAYPLPEWKKQVVCDFLARMRFNGLKAESAVRQQR
ncbi:hypothetical protein ACFLVO_00310 [Chloroflexota bacterium]